MCGKGNWARGIGVGLNFKGMIKPGRIAKASFVEGMEEAGREGPIIYR